QVGTRFEEALASLHRGQRKKLANVVRSGFGGKERTFQRRRPACSPLIHQEEVAILEYRRKLGSVQGRRADRVLARAAHQHHDRIAYPLSRRTTDHRYVDAESATIWAIRVFEDLEHTAPDRSGDTWKLARVNRQFGGGRGDRITGAQPEQGDQHRHENTRGCASLSHQTLLP